MLPRLFLFFFLDDDHSGIEVYAGMRGAHAWVYIRIGTRAHMRT